MFVSGINITSFNPATSATYLLHSDLDISSLNPLKVYHSDTKPWGSTFTKIIDFDPVSADNHSIDNLREYVEKLWTGYM